MIRRTLCLLLAGLTLGGCNSDSLGFEAATPGGPVSASTVSGRWNGELNGQPLNLVLEQDGTRVTGWGVRARNGLPDYVYVAGWYDGQSDGQVELLHSDAEDDFDNEKMWFRMRGGVLTAAMVDGPGPTQQTFPLTGSAPSAITLPGGSYQLEATGADREGKTVKFKIRVNLGSDGQRGRWNIQDDGAALLLGGEGALVAVVSPSLATAALTFFDNSGVNQGNVIFPVKDLNVGSPAALLSNSSKFITGSGPISVSGKVTLQQAVVLASLPSPVSSRLTSLNGRWVSNFGAPDRGIEFFLRQQKGTILGEAFIRTDGTQPRYLHVQGQVAAGGRALLHLSPESPLDGDEMTVVANVQDSGEWSGELFDSHQALISKLALTHHLAPTALGKVWDNDLKPGTTFTAPEVYELKLDPLAVTLQWDLTHVEGDQWEKRAVGRWSVTKGSFLYPAGEVMMMNLEHSPDSTYLSLSPDGLSDLKYWTLFPRFKSGKAGEQVEAGLRLGQATVPTPRSPGSVVFPIHYDDNQPPLFLPEIVFGNLTLLKP